MQTRKATIQESRAHKNGHFYNTCVGFLKGPHIKCNAKTSMKICLQETQVTKIHTKFLELASSTK